VKKQEWETVRTTAHSIKGSCRNMDMNRCGLAAEELERGGRECDANLSQTGLGNLEREFPQLKETVDKILSESLL
ncbi:MAG: Hpt domain-containing protein, partial [Spirochaetales bacterium]|nr:Hpt domain-containing protein [Spirochaetales bacterium]